MSHQIDLSWHFAVPLYQLTLNGYPKHKEALLEHICMLREQDAGIQRSNRRGWHSADDLQQDQNPAVKWLMHQLLQFTNGCAQNFDPEGTQGKTFALSSCWANINESGGWNTPHQHLPAQWSGVFYAQLDDAHFEQPGDGELMFMDPLPFGAEFKRGGTVSLRPSEGLVVLFPSYLMHMVAPHFGDKERISIAFNGRMIEQ